MNFQRALYLFIALSVLYSCRTAQIDKSYVLEPVEVRPENKVYRASAKRDYDLVHTKLDVSFDWNKQHLRGSAELVLTPYFYPNSSIILDAKGFELLFVGIIEGDQLLELPYTYDTLQINIDLKQTFTRDDTFTLKIEYIAKPNELEEGGSKAISSDKGLYFINPQGLERNKPMQIWTQGETEASSCWFPTIDKPNERTTQEIWITVPDTLATLSNGIHIESKQNKDGTRTDYWKQDLPHAPYLFMMAIGKFSITNDSWRDIAVDYYVEAEYDQYAKDIFGNTPEMLELYTKQLDYDFPWAKYSQVAVRDFVSGAMENTTASLYFDAVQKTKRELLDDDYEFIIAHELYHQWFGDLVTCESWSNLPLNESFATYGEYLWIDHKYGREEADMHLKAGLDKYLMESRIKQKHLIRFYYDNKEDMFDAHSYDKGGHVLHLLRDYVGDEAFFKSLNVYLTDNAFQSVEIHDLRLAFEKVTGEDMNWFFNQWFLSSGHPSLLISSQYNDSSKTVLVSIIQQREDNNSNTYRLPLVIDVYHNNQVTSEKVTIEKEKETFEIPADKKPDLVNVDGRKILLGVKKEDKSISEYCFQYANAPLYLDKHDAIMALAAGQYDNEPAFKTIIDALGDPFWGIRKLAVEQIADSKEPEKIKSLLKAIALSDEKSKVRAAAIYRLDALRDSAFLGFFKQMLNDSSYLVMSASLNAINNLDKDAALSIARQYEAISSSRIVTAISKIYASNGADEDQHYFEDKIYESKGFSRYSVISNYGDYLKKGNEASVRKGVDSLKEIASVAGSTWHRFAAMSAIHGLKDEFTTKRNKEESEKYQALLEELELTIASIIEQEKNPKLLDRYKAFN